MRFKTNQPATLHSHQLLSWFAALAIVGQVCLVASSLLLPAVSHYSILHDSISELALGRYGYIQTAAFLISGFGTLGLAFAIRKLTAGSRASLLGSLLIAIYGAGGILVALFPTDHAGMQAHSTSGIIHILSAVISFLCVTAGMFILTRTFKKEFPWRSFSSPSILYPTCALALLFVQTGVPFTGLTERSFICVVSVWLIMVACKVRQIVAATAVNSNFPS